MAFSGGRRAAGGAKNLIVTRSGEERVDAGGQGISGSEVLGEGSDGVKTARWNLWAFL